MSDLFDYHIKLCCLIGGKASKITTFFAILLSRKPGREFQAIRCVNQAPVVIQAKAVKVVRP